MRANNVDERQEQRRKNGKKKGKKKYRANRSATIKKIALGCVNIVES